jgi:hypothetical protein
MQDPKKTAVAYLVVGVLAIVSASYFLYLDFARGDSGYAMFDWVLLALGGVGAFRGAKSLLELRKDQKPGPPSDT